MKNNIHDRLVTEFLWWMLEKIMMTISNWRRPKKNGHLQWTFVDDSYPCSLIYIIVYQYNVMDVLPILYICTASVGHTRSWMLCVVKRKKNVNHCVRDKSKKKKNEQNNGHGFHLQKGLMVNVLNVRFRVLKKEKYQNENRDR